MKGKRAGGLRLTHAFVVAAGRKWEARGWLEKRDGSNSERRAVTTKMIAELGIDVPAWMGT